MITPQQLDVVRVFLPYKWGDRPRERGVSERKASESKVETASQGRSLLCRQGTWNIDILFHTLNQGEREGESKQNMVAPRMDRTPKRRVLWCSHVILGPSQTSEFSAHPLWRVRDPFGNLIKAWGCLSQGDV